jgi:16S rRNA (cytosine967-C5)-methyltransferase
MGETLENHATRVLQSVRPGLPADGALREYMKSNRTLGAVGKRSVSKAVFTYFRWVRWLDANASLQKQVQAAIELQLRFEKDPSSIKVEALKARAVPGWLNGEMDLPAGYLRKLQHEPALWIRPKSGRVDEVASALGSCERAVLREPIDSPEGLCALRFRGPADLHKAPLFQTGAFEIQDLASQLVGHACAPAPGETWWDACAGEGGKTLHLSDLMANKGLIWATDRSERRLETLRKRAARAGMFNYRVAPWTGGVAPFKTRCDGVLVDAPCSGVGTWQRNPHARWTTSIEDVTELSAVQGLLLKRAASSVKPGGRLVYAVCTLTRSETTAVADAFQVAHPDFEPCAIAISKDKAARLMLLPHEIDANGMFIASWKRTR